MVELLQHLHTSLQVGRSNRAELIIQRLTGACSPDSAELLHAHTAYLEQSLKAIALHGRGDEARDALKEMQRWFEVEVRKKGGVVDAKMVVVMIRASIRALRGASRDRTVQRYVEMAEQMGENCYYEVLESEEYDDNEFTVLNRIIYGGGQALQAPDETSTTPPPEPVQYRREDFLMAEEIPEVVPTEQRGEGLAGIKRALHDFKENPSLPASAPIDLQREQALERQRIMEETSIEIAVDRWRKADEELRKIGVHTAMQSKPIGALMWQWYQALLPALEAELAECKVLLNDPKKVDHDRYHYGPYLELLPLDKIAANTILHTLSRMAAKKRGQKKYELGVALGSLAIGLGRSIEQECGVNASKRKAHSGKKAGMSHLKRDSARQFKGRSVSRRVSKAEQKRRALLAQLQWPQEANVKFGAMLVTKLMETAHLPVTRLHPRTKEKITQMQPAFLHRWKYEKGKKIGSLSPNPALIEKIESEPVGSVIAKRMPMVVEPKPWTSWNEGGYLHYSNPIMRMAPGDRIGRDYFLAAYNKGDMSQIFAGLTALGEVPWKIHHGVFKVQVEAWNSGEAVANFAPLRPQLDVPPEPEPSTDPDPRRKWLVEVGEVENKRAGLHSKRCFQNFQLEIGRTMVNETLYFPHNMDFRGRAYPIPPYLNHMGADNVRGLLVFGRGKPLGPDGLKWLKIHLATVAGHDKASMAERTAFTEKHLDDIYDSVRNPLDGRRWWLEAEDAWQTLAACFELTEALDSPDPSQFISHLPIQQDGTCNGLQHYAALGGDKIGAAQVNLLPGDRPSDVYTAVAEAVKEDIRQDSLLGNPTAQKLDGHLTRKCVKQPVMTNVYGVTWYGAKEQVQRQLEDIFPEVRQFDEVNHTQMSIYVANKIFKSLGTMFRGAQAIQHWLGQCAHRISTCVTPEQIAELGAAPGSTPRRKAKGRQKQTGSVEPSSSQVPTRYGQSPKSASAVFKSTIVWTTPLRLPVAQPYRAVGRTRPVTTSLQGITLHEPRVWHPVSKRKQLQAFPPNFIHSLDATHMLLSALKCKELGITFASVHDSFWTHACDVDRMSVALRDSFVEMHKDNIVGRLREEFQTRYKGCMCLVPVIKKSPVGQKITEHRRNNKKSEMNELSLEAERMCLLASEDPEQRAKGEAMVTPGSIMASEGDESAVAVPSQFASHQLGTIPQHADVEATNTDSDERDMFDTTAETQEGVVPGSVLDTDVEAIPEQAANNSTEEDTGPRLGKDGKPKKPFTLMISVWVPLTFPDVPPKGEFDIHKIRDSHYFFH